MSSTKEIHVTFGEGIVIVDRTGSSGKAVANILGTQTDKAGEHFYLDRLVHTPFETELGGYRVTGAISSIITKPITQ